MGVDYIISSTFANLHQCEFLNKILLFFSEIGNNGYLFLIIAIFFIPFKKYRKIGIGLLISALLILIFNNLLLKKLIARDRPFVTYPELLPYVIGVPPSSLSFPSGHAAVTFSFASYLWCFKKKHSRLAIFATVFAVIVSFSRIYLIHHYFTDVMAGILLGAICGVGAYFIAPLVEKLFDIIHFFDSSECEE